MMFRASRVRGQERRHRHEDESLKEILIGIRSALNSSFVKDLRKIMAKLEDLEREVSEMGSVVESAVAVIASIRDELKSAGTDQAKLDALAAKLDSDATKLANAIANGTDAEGDIEPEPTP